MRPSKFIITIEISQYFLIYKADGYSVECYVYNTLV